MNAYNCGLASKLSLGVVQPEHQSVMGLEFSFLRIETDQSALGISNFHSRCKSYPLQCLQKIPNKTSVASPFCTTARAEFEKE